MLLASSLLVTPQTEDFFKAVIVLSLWSTTIGQVPLSIDGWLITSYAVQQAAACPGFTEITTHSINRLTDESASKQYIWVHLCLSHLQ